MATKGIKVRVTLEIPLNLIPEEVEDKAFALKAILTGILGELKVRVLKVNAKDLR